jgi:hypothetical protein
MRLFGNRWQVKTDAKEFTERGEAMIIAPLHLDDLPIETQKARDFGFLALIGVVGEVNISAIAMSSRM